MISKWKLKAVVQKIISFLPYPEKINFIFQKHITNGVILTDEHFGYKIQHAIDHVNYLQKHSEKQHKNIVLELGTGWYPIIPIWFYLNDVGNVISVDIHNWMNGERLYLVIKKLFEWRRKGRLPDHFKNINERKWMNLSHVYHCPSDYDMDQINVIIGLECILQDARKLDLADDSVDFICSNNTLEHISREYLQSIFHEFLRVLKPSGVMSHFIDCSDHFAHFDKSITIYNFLKFSERNWKLIDNKIQPQNRMRFVDYKRMYSELGIPISDEKITSGDLDMLRKVDINEEFADYTEQELAVSHAYIVSQP